MKTRRFFTLTLAIIGMASLVSFTSCDKDDDNMDAMEKDIVETAVADMQFSSLVAALVKADLVGALKGDGPFTVFAPTDEAFEQLFIDLGITGLDELSAADLAPILLYHVVSGNVMSTDLSNGYVATLSSGPGDNSLNLLVDADNIMLNGDVSITSADIETTNGVIHVINKVLLPPTVVDLAIDNSNFSTLVAAVLKAELAETLSGTGPFTVFAPTNAAFDDLFTALEVTGIDQLTKEQLIPILQYHVVAGNVRSTDLSTGSVTTLNGDIDINVGMSVTINTDANVVATDVQGSNGVVHVIDKVLVPQN
jgi:transforming growth factor-beta-induced protein